MDISKLRTQSVSELQQQLLELLKEQFNLRMQKGMSEMPRPHLYKFVRRDIARIKTVLREKEREA